MSRWSKITETVAVVSAVLLAGYSCTGVDLHDAEVLEKARYLCRVATPSEGGAPDEYVLAMARSINTIHDTAHVNPYIFDDTLYISSGNYYALLWGFVEPGDYEVPAVNDFLEHKGTSLLDLKARLREKDFSGSDDALVQALIPQDNTVPLIPEATPIYRSCIRGDLLYRSDGIDYLDFAPETFIQRLTFIIKVETEGDVVIEDAAASVCGLAAEVGLMEASISPSVIGRTIFGLDARQGGTYSAAINTLGLFSPINSGDLFGRGVLTVVFRIQGVSKITEVHINLGSALEKAALMEEVDVTGEYRLLRSSATVDVSDKVVHIRHQGDSASESGAFEVWVEGDEDHTVEVIPDEPDD